MQSFNEVKPVSRTLRKIELYLTVSSDFQSALVSGFTLWNNESCHRQRTLEVRDNYILRHRNRSCTTWDKTVFLFWFKFIFFYNYVRWISFSLYVPSIDTDVVNDKRRYIWGEKNSHTCTNFNDVISILTKTDTGAMFVFPVFSSK